jgi:PAS domain S-box-containing protein
MDGSKNMVRFFNNLRMGEKIGLGFGLVGLLFLGVIWQYQMTLTQSLSDYQRLLDVFEAKKSLTLNIELFLLEARRAEKDFLIHRKEAAADKVTQYVGRIRQEAVKLKKIDADALAVGEQISKFMKTYHTRFEALVAAWRKKGLDHNAGLQGRFRDRAHELEDLADNFKVGSLYLQLLQIRRGEKDLGLRHERQYYVQVLELINGFKEKISISELEKGLTIRLYKEIDVYRNAFAKYAQDALADKNINGGKGPFRNAAHRIEDLLKTHYVPDLEKNILQLRRREKDYLLRHDKQYVRMAQEEIQTLRSQVSQSGISAGNKQKFNALLDSYETDFLALVKKNDIIGRLVMEMNDAARQITQIVEHNVETSDRTMQETTETINAESQANSRLMLIVVFVALLLGISFAVFITRYITHSLHRIGTVLSRIAHSDPTDRVPVTGGRDELDAMGAAVNTMSDQMERLIAWSMATCREDDSHLRSVIYSIPPGLFITNKDGVIETLNPELANMLGYSPLELIGQSINRLFTTREGPDQGQSLFDQIESHDIPGVGAGREMIGLSIDNRKIPLSLIVGRVGSGENQRYAGLVLDITLCRETEANWHQARDEKQELLSLMSHEIYTLMDSISSMVDDLAETDHAGKRRSYAEIMKQSGQWVLDIIDVILGYSKGHTQWLELNETDFDLHLLIDNLSLFFSNFARIKGIEYRVQRSAGLPVTVHGDSGNLSLILMHLLSNAVKFTKTGEIIISMELISEDETGYQIGFLIQDSGSGIDSAKLEHLFEHPDPVTDADTFEYKRPFQGLVITKQLVGLLGGVIEVSSQLGKGTNFTVNLPLKKV